MDYYRVLNWHPDAATPAENGHPLYIWPQQGSGRIDDYDQEYRVLYVGDHPVGAVAEVFGGFSVWTKAILDPPPTARPGARKALVRLRGDLDVLDLDDPGALMNWHMRPSTVVSRVRATTQAWARTIYDAGGYDGISWWSYYDPQWASTGLWDTRGLVVVDEPEVLTLDHPLILEAASIIKRVIS